MSARTSDLGQGCLWEDVSRSFPTGHRAVVAPIAFLPLNPRRWKFRYDAFHIRQQHDWLDLDFILMILLYHLLRSVGGAWTQLLNQSTQDCYREVRRKTGQIGVSTMRVYPCRVVRSSNTAENREAALAMDRRARWPGCDRDGVCRASGYARNGGRFPRRRAAPREGRCHVGPESTGAVEDHRRRGTVSGRLGSKGDLAAQASG